MLIDICRSKIRRYDGCDAICPSDCQNYVPLVKLRTFQEFFVCSSIDARIIGVPFKSVRTNILDSDELRSLIGRRFSR